MSAPTVLLLDDDEVLRQVLRRVLSRQGLQVVEAGDLAQARQVLAEQQFKLGLFDLCLPDGDGVELAKEIQESGLPMPLILMTAYPLRLREQPDLAERFTRVLSKPVNLQELRETVDAALAGTAKPVATQAATPAAAVAAQPPAPSPAPPAVPPSPAPQPAAPPVSIYASSRGYLRLRPLVIGGVAVIMAAVALLFMFPEARKLLDWNKVRAGEGIHLETLTAKAVVGDPNGIELSKEVVEQMKVKTVEVKKADADRPLQLAGSLALDPDKIARRRSLFAGEVIEVAKLSDPDAADGSGKRPLRFGDSVKEGQLLAVIYSKDLGEKKSELIDNISQLRVDKDFLDSLEALYQKGATTEVNVKQQRRNVQQDAIALNKSERTLRTWKVSEAEIKEVKDEAERVIARNGEHDMEKEKNWAKVEIRASIPGIMVEKNLTVGDVVDSTTILFQIADMRTLKVWVNVPEEDLPVLRAAKEAREADGKKLTWKINFTTDPTIKEPAEGEVEAISPLIDPTQHTAIMMGWVKNDKGNLHSSQFVSATIELPAPQNTVSIPTAALLEDGTESLVFVQPDADKPVYSAKRVIVTKRFHDVAQIKRQLTKEEIAKGYSPLGVGERVVTQSALEMKEALDDVKAKAKPPSTTAP
jgi:cobalt-zinc-cadmium efflux system membrane fusion protein